MTEGFFLWKTAHALSASLLFGGGLTIAFFCWFGYRSALRSRDIASLRTTLKLTVLADLCITAPAVVFQAGSGLLLMRMLEWPLTSPWSIVVWSLFLLVGACWLPVIALQIRLSRMAAATASVDSLPAQFHRGFRVWFALGIPAFILVAVVFYLMLAKPLPIA